MYDRVLLTLLQLLTTAGFLAVGLLTAWAAVRALTAERGVPLGDIEVRYLVVAAGALFVVGFYRVVVASRAGVVGTEALAMLALGFAGMTYLLSRERPGAFATGGPAGVETDDDPAESA